MALPTWMKDYPGAPEPGGAEPGGAESMPPEGMVGHLGAADVDEQVGIRPCACHGEGCDDCYNTGVIYP